MANMTNIEIIGAIMMTTGKRVEQYAKDEGLSVTVVYRVINGTSKYQRIREAIAKTIGMTVLEIWPEG